MSPDLPTRFVTVTSEGRTKRVEDYVGAPAGLTQLEREVDAARALISAGASVVARDERGESALGRAASLAPELTAVLLKAGAPADLQVNLEGATALIWAASLGNISAGSPGWSQDDSCRISTR